MANYLPPLLHWAPVAVDAEHNATFYTHVRHLSCCSCPKSPIAFKWEFQFGAAKWSQKIQGIFSNRCMNATVPWGIEVTFPLSQSWSKINLSQLPNEMRFIAVKEKIQEGEREIPISVFDQAVLISGWHLLKFTSEDPSVTIEEMDSSQVPTTMSFMCANQHSNTLYLEFAANLPGIPTPPVLKPVFGPPASDKPSLSDDSTKLSEDETKSLIKEWKTLKSRMIARFQVDTELVTTFKTEIQKFVPHKQTSRTRGEKTGDPWANSSLEEFAVVVENAIQIAGNRKFCEFVNEELKKLRF